MSMRQNWTVQEDNYLRSSIPFDGKVNWMNIAESMSSQFLGKNRTAKQCRERFINHCKYSSLDHELAKWKAEDIEILYKQFQKYGSSWTRIAESLPGKSENAVKNKFYGTLRKIVRKMNSVNAAQSKKKKKSLRHQSVIRVIQAATCFHNLENALKEESLVLRQQVFSMIKEDSSPLNTSEILELSQNINKFNLKTRSFRSKKSKSKDQQQSVDESKLQQRPTSAQICSKGEYLKQFSGPNSQQMDIIKIECDISGSSAPNQNQAYCLQQELMLNEQFVNQTQVGAGQATDQHIFGARFQAEPHIEDLPSFIDGDDDFLSFYHRFPQENYFGEEQFLFD